MNKLFKASVLLGSIGCILALLGIGWIGVGTEQGFEKPIVFMGIGLSLIGGILLIGAVTRWRRYEQLSWKSLCLLIASTFLISIGSVVYIYVAKECNVSKLVIYFTIVHLLMSIGIKTYLFIAATYKIQRKRRLSPYVVSIITLPFVIYTILTDTNGNLGFMIVTSIVSLYVFLLIFIQVIFILKRDKGICFFPKVREDGCMPKRYYIFTSIYLFILPLVGFAMNGLTMLLSVGRFSLWGSGQGVVGDFSHPIFLILTLFNVVIYLIPPYREQKYPKVCLYLKTVGMSFILYMCIAFIPIVPLGVIGILFYGLGLLAFIPLIAMIWEGFYFYESIKRLCQSEERTKTIGTILAGAMTLPLLFGSIVAYDHMNFEQARRCADGKEIGLRVDKQALKRTISEIEAKSNGLEYSFPFNTYATPILSSLYYEGVVGSRDISDAQLDRINRLYFHKAYSLWGGSNQNSKKAGSEAVNLVNIHHKTTYDEKDKVYRTWVDLVLHNNSGENNQEYANYFSLPKGVYITDYYLVVGEEKKYGILADERAATETYTSIVSRSLDPGIVKYYDEDTIELRVFPFEALQQRETGFEIIHKGDLDLQIDNRQVKVEVDKEIPLENIRTLGRSGITVLESQGIDDLPEYKTRQPIYYFLIDGSKDSDLSSLIKRTKDYISEEGIEDAQVFLVGERILSKGLDKIEKSKVGLSGYNLNGAIQDIMRKEKEGYYPVLIAVSDKIEQAVLPYGIKALEKKYPESTYYILKKEGLTRYDMVEGQLKLFPGHNEIESYKIREYKGQLVLDDGNRQYIATKDISSFKSTGNQYDDATLLEAMSWHYTDYDDEELLSQVKGSFQARVLSQSTAFIVVETKEQEKELLKLQAYYLDGKQWGMEAPKMSEPPIWIWIIGIIGFIIWNRYDSIKYIGLKRG